MKAKIARAAAALLWAALVLPAAADLSGPRKGVQVDPTGGVTFEDVKSEPLRLSDVFTTTWMLHASTVAAGPNYAGVLFNLHYDSHELSQLTLKPLDPHVWFQPPPPDVGLVDALVFEGSQSDIQVVPLIAAFIDPGRIAESGLALEGSQLLPIFQLQGHVKGTTVRQNSDLDIWIEPWIIRHVPSGQTSQIIELPLSAYVYVGPNGEPGAVPPGEGFWRHFPGGPLHVVGSALYAIRAADNSAGFGIEHVPEPASLALLALGAGALAIGRWRQRRT